MPDFAFQQVDVFATAAFKGNPLAVVISGDTFSDAEMAAFANWTNLSETTFLLKPTTAGADYRLRIFTPNGELPFAGHPTLGSCHVWLASGGKSAAADVVQECGVGLVRIRRDDDRLAFAAPPLRRTGAVAIDLLAQIARGLRISPEAILRSQWVDNGSNWVAVMLRSRAEVLALQPDFATLENLKLGVIAPCTPADGVTAQFEVRAFVPGKGSPEDPVTGSLNAGLAQWLIGAGIAPASYIASQGTAIGRAGRVHIQQIGDDIWVGGNVTARITGTLTL